MQLIGLMDDSYPRHDGLLDDSYPRYGSHYVLGLMHSTPSVTMY